MRGGVPYVDTLSTYGVRASHERLLDALQALRTEVLDRVADGSIPADAIRQAAIRAADRAIALGGGR